MHGVVLAGWTGAAAIGACCYFLPLLPILIVLSVYVLLGMVKLSRTGAPVLFELNFVQLLALCIAWPLALRTRRFKEEPDTPSEP